MKSTWFYMATIVIFFNFLSLAEAAPTTHYFVKMYGFANWRNAAAYSHTYGSFFRVTEQGDAVRVDISWIPQDEFMSGPGDMRMPAFGDFPGQNMSVVATNARASSAFPARTISAFGPYEISADLFYRELAQSRRLFSGAITYRGLDMSTAPSSVNCVHAISRACGDFRTGILLRGPSASWGLVQYCADEGLLSLQEVDSEWSSRLDGWNGVTYVGMPRRIGCNPSLSDNDVTSADCDEGQQ